VAQFLHQFVDRLYSFAGRQGQFWGIQSKLTGEEQGGHGVVQFALEAANGGLAGLYFFALAALDGGADIADEAIDAADREVDLHRNGSAQMFECGVGFAGLGFDKILIEYRGRVAASAQERGGAGQTFRHVYFFASCPMQRRCAFAGAIAWRHEKDHAGVFATCRPNAFF
jgi:hypothetical protein